VLETVILQCYDLRFVGLIANLRINAASTNGGGMPTDDLSKDIGLEYDSENAALQLRKLSWNLLPE
jgi:hypothetical protein